VDKEIGKPGLIRIYVSMLVIAGILLSADTQAGAETLKGKSVSTATKDERIAVNDEAGHVLVLQILEGLTYFENGEVARLRSHSIVDAMPGRDAQAITYSIWTFDDGSTVVNRSQRMLATDSSGKNSAKVTSEFIKGTGRFQGIKGTGSGTGRNFLPSEGHAARSFSDFNWTYTLPGK
jgi:hypothetical protein